MNKDGMVTFYYSDSTLADDQDELRAAFEECRPAVFTYWLTSCAPVEKSQSTE